jgi:cytochrome c-type biogenesis protein CcmH/NrfG
MPESRPIKDAAPMAEVAQEVLQAALRYYSAGDFSAAERIVDAVLRTKPKHPDALHLWGLLAHQAGRTDQAMESIRRIKTTWERFMRTGSNSEKRSRAIGARSKSIPIIPTRWQISH